MTALILVDIQRDFMSGGALAVKDAEAILPCVNFLLEKPFQCIVASKDWHPKGHISFASTHPGKKVGDSVLFLEQRISLWPEHCLQEQVGSELHPSIDQSKIKKIFYKGACEKEDSYSAFFNGSRKQSTGLNEFLKKQGVHKVIIVGLVLEYCVGETALDAKLLGYDVWVVKEGVASLFTSNKEKEDYLLNLTKSGIHLISLRELIETKF